MQKHSLSEPTTFAVATLGCKVNQADSDAIGEQMNAAGFLQRDFSDHADIYIVNTCTVTHLGDRSSRQLISQARRRHPDALLVVTGCYAELNPKAVAALPGVDLVVGNSGKGSLVESIAEQWRTGTKRNLHDLQITEDSTTPPQPAQRYILPMLPLDAQHIGSDTVLAFDGFPEEPQPDNPSRLSPFIEGTTAFQPADSKFISRTRVQMKVQDGCNNRSTYCIVPYVRAKSRSRSHESIVEHVRRKVRAGYQEIVLTGIHLGDYHPEGDEQRDLGDLIATLLRETDI